MTPSSPLKLVLAALAICCFGWFLPVARAQESPAVEEKTQDDARGRAGESADAAVVSDQIVVTARKREEVLSDVPISISLIRGETMEKANITDLSQMALLTPNFHHSEDVNSFDRFIVRGLGTTGSVLGFEEAVGQVINGYFFGRSRFGRTMFLDLERVEVLKGPQGALIGKNNSVGAINITTRKPGNSFGGYVFTTVDFDDAAGFATEGAVDVPISPKLRSRFAARVESKDGWVTNFGTGREDQERDDVTVRGLLDWTLNDTTTAEFMIQAGRLDRVGRNREIYNCLNDARSDAPRDPNEDCLFNSKKDVVFMINGVPSPESHDTDYSIFGLTLNKYFDDLSLTYLGNFAEYKSADAWDSDHAVIEWTHIFVDDDWRQNSHEIRLASNGGGKLDFIAGLYYGDQRNDYIQSFMFCRGPLGLCTGGNTNPGFRGLQRHGYATLNTESLALFGQVDWHFEQDWTLTLGGRFTEENRDIQTNATVLTPYSLEVTPATQVDCPNVTDQLDGVGVPIGFDCGPAQFTNSGFFDRSESDFNPNATLRWQPTGEATYYLTYAEGFKSGGFQFPTYVPQAALTRDLIEYEAETTTHYELGGKHSFSKGQSRDLRFNWAIWSTDFLDVQVSALDPIAVIQNVNNAAQANSTGIEGDLFWRIGRRTALTAAASLLNAEYDDFRTAPCYAGQTAAQGCLPIAFPNGSVADVQDLTGTALAYAPKRQFSIGLSGNGFPVATGAGFELGYDFFYYWQDDFHFVLANDPLDSQNAYGKVNASVSLGRPGSAWSLALVGKNLTDELTANAGDSTAALGQRGDIGPTPNFKFAEPGRQIGLQFRYRF